MKMGHFNTMHSLAITICLLGIMTDGQIVRTKRQISQDQPRLLINDGDLIFQCGGNHNIKLLPSSGGAVFIGKENLTLITEMVKRNKVEIDSLKAIPNETSSDIGRRVSNIEHSIFSLQSLPNEIATLTSSFNTLKNTVDSTSANRRLLSVESSLENLQPTGQVQSQLNDVIRRLSTLESRNGNREENGANNDNDNSDNDNDNQETTRGGRQRNGGGNQRGGDVGRSNGRNLITWNNFRRLRRRVQTLETSVRTLLQLLNTNECQSNPCQNGGTCVDTYNGFNCQCPANWKGTTCSVDVNECSEYAGTDKGCQNGATCFNLQGTFRCDCTPNFYGILCSSNQDDCNSASHEVLCAHGTCINELRVLPGQPKYRCLCEDGWTHSANSSNSACNTDKNECSEGRFPCSTDPLVPCINVPGTFYCGSCPTGFIGNGFTCQDVNECEVNNGGCSVTPRVDCLNTHGSRTCGPCPPGYQGNGVTCTWNGMCSTNNGGCHSMASCSEIPGVYGVTCTCQSGFVGNGLGVNGCLPTSFTNACSSSPCTFGNCTVLGNTFVCSCNPGYTGRVCDSDINECTSSPCLNGGTCVNSIGSFNCICSDFTGNLCQNPQQSCGGHFTSPSGIFSYPHVSGTFYSNNISCVWQITTAPDKILMITFQRFLMEFHPQCNFDFLQIHDGGSASAQMIGRYCGERLPNDGNIINSTQNQLYFWFKSDVSVGHGGFQVNWTSANPVCGGQLTNSSHGNINSPGYPGPYPNNRDCVWVVSVPPGNNIIIHFAYLAIEHHINCSYDYLEIRSGQLPTSPLLQRFCSTSTPGPITTEGPYAYIYFHTDTSLNDRGFHITYSAVSAGGGCGGAYTDSEGTFTSPNFPRPYNHNAVCVWTINANGTDSIRLHFNAFELETSSSCEFDYLEIRDGINETGALLGRFCGISKPADVITSGNSMFLKFHSDTSMTGRGFSAFWSTACGGTFSLPQGTIQSPSYPNNYPHNRQCTYLIRQPEGAQITLIFNAFRLEESLCNYDYVEIRDGGSASDTLLGERYCGSSLPPTQRSTQNLMSIYFVTDGSVTNMGFQAFYTTEINGCGGALTSQQGIIRSPGHPNTYPHGANCTWYITVDPGLIIQLTFNSFNLEDSTTCSFDYVMVYDNSTADNSSLIGKYCGTIVPPMITSTSHVLMVFFRSDASISSEGFSASYITQNATTACGRTLTQSTGIITSPDFPRNYPDDRDCIWTIIVTAGNQIRINFTEFALEANIDCSYDYLDIRNGGYSDSPLYGRFCGSSVRNPIISHSNSIWLRFHSDSSSSATGFQLFFDGTSTGCGGDLTTPTGSFISPNYPAPYTHNSECFWTIRISHGSIIQLFFLDFDVESHNQCNFDYLEVRDTSAFGRQLGKFCGNTIPDPINSTTNIIWIKYRTDFSVSGRGFHAAYATVCNNRLTSPTGIIESPNFPQPYHHLANCSWIIDTSDGSTLNISFSSFNLESHRLCQYDYLEIQDGDASDSPVLGRFCGTSMPTSLVSSTDKLRVKFVSDGSISRTGFHLEYITSGCGGQLTNSSGNFSSPNYPNSYDHARICEWLITVENGKAIELVIHDFDMEHTAGCSFDALEIFAGTDITGIMLSQLCNTQYTAQTMRSTGNAMFIRMRTDNSVSGRGFRASYSTIDGGCGGNFSTHNSLILSPNYPNNYPSNTECEWHIMLPLNQLIVFNFMDFDVVGSNCNYNFVALYDGPDGTYPLLKKACGHELPDPSIYRSSTSYMFIKMKTNSSLTGRGFKANYTAGCGGVINASSDGEIFSVNYPRPYPRNSNCTWLVFSDRNTDRITLTVTHMDIGIGDNCATDYVSILNGNSINSPEIGTYCGTFVPPAITSFGSSLYIIFVSDIIEPGTGFRATYSRSTSSCGGHFTGLSGAFLSPAYPDSYPFNIECVWTIASSPGNRVTVFFSVFNIEASDSCSNDYVEVRHINAMGSLLGRWCGSSTPATLTVANFLWIKFHSDSDITGVGFRGEWNSVYGGDLNGTSGQVASPGYPQNYINNANVVWIITVPIDMQVLIFFQMIHIEMSSSGCSYDYIKIRDGGLAASEEIGLFCGTNLPDPLISSSNQVRLEFISDSRYSGQGFLLNWTATNERPPPLPTTETSSPASGCGGNLLATNSVQTLQSQGYPIGYAVNLNCIWVIAAPVHHRVWVNITNIDLESHASCNFDFITIFDSATINGHPIGTFCGRIGNTVPILSSTNVLTVRFNTDRSISHSGFRLNYRAECGGRLTERIGVISSHNYPNNYPDNSNCTWNVWVTNSRTIHIKFIGTFNIPSSTDCGSDYVELLNGGNSDSPPLLSNGTTNGHYCGSQLPSEMETSSNQLTVNFVSDESGSGAGFSLQYNEVSVTCGGTLTLTISITFGYFTSPNYPDNYPHSVDCIWIIIGPANERIQVDFVDVFNIERHIQCNYDYIEFLDGATGASSLIGRFCGPDLPGSVVSTGNIMHTRFHTDSSVTNTGFKAIYKIATCGGRISGQKGTIISPNYPSNYSSNGDCKWYINGPVGHYLTILFNTFSLEASSNCSNDYLEIREFNETGNILLKACGQNIPSSFDTSDSFAFVHFVSNINTEAEGFNMTYQASIEECGGILTTTSGSFVSPNYPRQYAHSRQCDWFITVQVARRVTLSFNDFGLECSGDYVEVYNGILPDSPSLGRFCGSSNPGVIESSANTMRVKFRSDGFASNIGFSAHYISSHEATCGGTFTTLPVNITSPGYYDNGNYSNNLHCIWQIENPQRTNSSIKIIVNDLALERHNQCGYDFLEFREGLDNTGPLIEKFCGNNTIPKPVVTHSHLLWIRFRTDHSIVDRGFHVNFQFTSCGGILSSPNGVITSPNYPNDYNHNDACAWLISAPDGNQIKISFTYFSMENHSNCDYDYLDILNGGLPDSPSIGHFCGITPPPTFVSQSNQVRLIFLTDVSDSAWGFRATYSFESGGCGGLYHSNDGYITTPNYPANYPNNTECIWDINVENGYIIKFQFETFHLQEGDCSRDFVEISDILSNGTQVQYSRWCSNVIPPPFTSRTKQLIVKFRSDFSESRNGFSANWTSDCGGLFTANEGVLLSPGYPNVYRHNLRCNYTIVGNPEHIILFGFDSSSFSIEGGNNCPYDFIQVFTGNSSLGQRLGRFCGNVVPQPVSSLGSMYIQFWTDSSISFTGFKALYTTQACGGIYTHSMGMISTPANPFNYLDNSNCSWTIIVNANNIIALKFVHFNIEAHSRCDFDYVDIYDGADFSAPHIGRFCGEITPDVIKSTGNNLFVNFVSDTSITHSGFTAFYWATFGPQHGCGGILNQTNGQITSFDADGDGNYENYLDCRWTIYVGPNMLVTLNITNMDLEFGADCIYDYLAVYDGLTVQDELLGKFCGNGSFQQMLTASSNIMLVQFVTDGSIFASGFRAGFGQQSALCGGILIATQVAQNISSPNYPHPANQAVQCQWTIDSGFDNQTVSLSLLDIDLNEDSSCSQEYVQFRDSPLGLLGSSVHYCGTSLPQTFDSVGQMVQVKYNVPGGSTSKGFLLSYAQADCNKNMSDSGRITSPGYPGIYPQNINCTTTIMAPFNTSLSIYFTQFFIEPHPNCMYDYLEIRNGTRPESAVIARVCGNTIPNPVFISSNQASITFKTDLSVQHMGYDISFTSTDQGLGCGGYLTGLNGSLTSPGFPGNYFTRPLCSWHISTSARRTLKLTFTYLAVPGVSDCSNNYVEVFDGPNNSSPTMGQYCEILPAVLTATGNKATVRLVSTGSSPAPSFRIIYTS